MEKLRGFVVWFAIITTGVVIVCAVNFSIFSEGDIPEATLWQILLTGLLTTAVTVYFPGEAIKRYSTTILHIMHYICLCAVMFGCGTGFGWMELDAQGIIMMSLSVAGVYIFSFTVNYVMDKKQADEINKRLKERYSGKEDF